LSFFEALVAYCGRGFSLGKKQDFSWSVPGLSSKKSEELSVIVFSDKGAGQAHRADAVQNTENTDMTVFSNLCSDTSRQDNTTAFPRKSSFSTRIGKIAQTSCGDEPKGGDNREAEKNAYKNSQPK